MTVDIVTELKSLSPEDVSRRHRMSGEELAQQKRDVKNLVQFAGDLHRKYSVEEKSPILKSFGSYFELPEIGGVLEMWTKDEPKDNLFQDLHINIHLLPWAHKVLVGRVFGLVTQAYDENITDEDATNLSHLTHEQIVRLTNMLKGANPISPLTAKSLSMAIEAARPMFPTNQDDYVL